MPTLAEILRNYQPPTESALADPIVEHFKNLPQKTSQNAIAMNDMVQNAMPYNPQTGEFETGPTFKEFTNAVPNMMGVTKAIKAGSNLIPDAYKQAFAMEAKTGYRPNASEMDKIMKIQEMMANEKALRKEMLAKKIGKLEK
jgi:hypothetical protein